MTGHATGPLANPPIPRPVRVLIVDDSATMRKLIAIRLRSDPRINVVGEAADTQQARRAIAALRPDLLTLDVEMPGQSGIEFLREIMRLRPLPVIMVSSETQSGSAAAIEALCSGAIDCVGKPRPGYGNTGFADLPALVVEAAGADLRRRRPPMPRPPPIPSQGFAWNGRILLIGASTGGVEAVERIIAALPVNCPPTLIVQHMPPAFLASFAQRLNQRHAPQIALADDGAPLQQGRVLIAPGGAEHLALGLERGLRCRLLAQDKVNGHRPSVDMLFGSGVGVARRIVAVTLSGMGSDGAMGMLALRRAGATCLAQDQASSVVWGMPRIAWQIGAAERLVSLDRMAGALLDLTGVQGSERGD
ncbi:chemotaxis-specific protein-glutamate methyltransferase CheB [Paracoccus jeotgali]|uniref:chemotaxis-specific protein-glutamate methyltransferase CheB n=1 Tax=Paracoccus jeotgali TaxID=2065379 RepID=UPI0028AB293C|nr:chemotaxis-specific protein-glutamate methyltransferase CheB [Paracoccus jeotgali]